MEDKITHGYLYDFYGKLLNEHQRAIYEAYAYEDLSLAEIAEQKGISRQAVHDLIRRCTKSLENYEQALQLLTKFLKIREDVERIQTLTMQARGTEEEPLLSEIRAISSNILEEF